MESTNRVELKCTTNSELPRKMVAKSGRSSTTHDKKSIVRVVGSDIEPKDKSSTGTVAREAERVDHHVPIKKRKFTVFPSRSTKKSSDRRGSSQHGTQINHISRFNQKLIDRRTSEDCDKKLDCNGHGFSGLAILAAVCESDKSSDLGPAADHPEEPVVQQQDASTLSTHAVDSIDQLGQGKKNIVAPQKSSVESLCNEQSIEHTRVSFGGMVAAQSTERLKANKGASESGGVTMSEKSSAGKPIEKKNKSLKNVRLHWDLNVSMDAWSQPLDVEVGAFERDIDGESTESMAPKESKPIDGSKDHLDGLIASDGQANFSSPSGPKAEAAAKNGKECRSYYDSQLEDGELTESYPLEEKEVEDGDVESNDTKMEDSDKGILAQTKFRPVKCEAGDALRIGEANNDGSDIEKQVEVCVNDLHMKTESSSSSRFVSKPFKELSLQDAIQRIRSDDSEEFSMGPHKFLGRDDKSYGRGYYSGYDSRPSYYKGGSYGFERPQSKRMIDDRGKMDSFDQTGSGPGPRSQPDGYVRKKFSNDEYRGRFRMFPDGGDRYFRGPHGDDSQYPGQMSNRMSGYSRERGNSPAFRRMHYPQSESRYRSRSPVPWNGPNRLSPSRDGFRADERMMEREKLPFRSRFPADQEIGSMSPPRNKMPSPRLFERRSYDSGENHNSYRERKFQPEQSLDVGKYSLRRVDSDNNEDIRPKRPYSSEDNTGGNKSEMAQQKTRRAEITEDDSFTKKQSVGGAKNNNNDDKECSENKIT